MALTQWSMKGVEVTNCNCNAGCPCQFNQLPSHGNCRAWGVVEVENGRYGDVQLDGLRWGIFASWPGPIHHGNGTFQVVVDQKADAKQRAALEAIGQGKDTEPGKLIWQVFSTTVTNMLPTVSAPIDISYDIDKRTANVKIGKILDGTLSPIVNPVTKQPHRVRVTLPDGFEYTDAEYATGRAKGTGDIPIDFQDTHAHFARVHWSTQGVVR